MSLFTKRSVASITAGLHTMVADLQAHADAMFDRSSKEDAKAEEHLRLSVEAWEEGELAVGQIEKLQDLLV
jgi:hypothetical protein